MADTRLSVCVVLVCRVESLMEKERDFCTRMALTDGNQL